MEATIDTTEVRRWKRYESQEATNQDWFPTLPREWDTMRLKYLTNEQFQYGANESGGGQEADAPRFVRITDIDEHGNLRDETRCTLSRELAEPYLLQKGDMLFARSGATVGKSFLYRESWGEACYAGYLIRVRPRLDGVLPRFVSYYTASKQYWGWISQQQLQATTQNVSAEKYANLWLPVPPLEEQQAIVAFLDRETARIDALIGHKERLIALLEEKRQAVISHAVTRGLDPNAKMKDSGCDILGMVPLHWRPMKLKYLFQFAKRQDFPDETVLSVYRDYGVIEKSTRDDNHNRTPLDLTSYQLVEPGDLVINKMKSWQGSLGISNLRGITSPDYVVYRSTNSEHLPYLHQLLRSRQMATYYHTISNGIRNDQWRLEPDKFEQTVLHLPSDDEQKAIAEFIVDSLSEADVVRSKIREGIERLEEYRTALISAAVTGQIDVREEVAVSDG